MRIKILIMCVLLFVFCTGLIKAQTTSGSITGTVVDPQEAAVAGATVTVTEEGKGFSLNATTDAEGRFVFPVVQPGMYKITIEASGFKKQERTGVALVSNDRLTLGNLSLEVGAPSEVVEVKSEATLLQSDSGERSFGIQGEQIRNLGVKTRSYINLATLAPGVVANGAGDGNSENSSGISVNGVRTNSNNVQIDGITSVDTGNNAQLSRIPLDSVGEFKLVTSSSQAEYGRSSGAQIIAVTRSGSQDFRGSFYYYRRHTGLNANTFENNRSRPATNNPRPISDQEDIGYTIGGPIYIPKFFNTNKKRLFFFVNQEWTPRITPNGVNRVRVPTALERVGDFSQSMQSSSSNNGIFNTIWDRQAVGTCTSANTQANPGACFNDGSVLGRIPQNRLYAPGLRLLNLYPLPNHVQLPGENYNYEEQISNDTKERNDTVRIDYNINDKWRVYGRMLNNYNVNTNPFSGLGFILGGNIGEWGWKNDTPRLSFAGTLNGALDASTAVEFTYGFSRNSIDGTTNTDKYTFTSSGLSALPRIFPNATQQDLLPQVGYGGGPLGPTPSYRVGNGPFINSNRTDNIAGSLSKVWGDHVSKFGGVYERGVKNQTNRVQFNGGISFSPDTNNPFDTNQGFANAATGAFNNYIQASAGTSGQYKFTNVEFYAQDNWKLSKRLTLDYGMRFSWLPPTYDASGKASNFDPTQYSLANAPRLYNPGCLGQAVGSFTPTGCTRVAYDPALPVGTILTGGGLPGSGGNSLNGGLFIAKLIPGTGNRANGLVAAGNKALTEDQGLLFAPRIGFAFDLTGKGNLILRGGFGIFYDRSQGNLVFDYNENPPTTTTTRYDFGQLQNLGGVGTIANLSPQFIRAIEKDAKIPTVNSYNIGIQYKLPFDTVLDVAYVGSQSHHLPHVRPLNETPFGSAWLAANQDPTRAVPTVLGASALPTDLYRPFRGFGGINFIEFRENSDYNSLQIGANRRFSQGLVLSANYTLSRANGITSADDGQSRIDQKDYVNYGRLGFDRTHNFNLNWVYEIPGLTKNRYLGLITNGWQFSGIYRFQSGQPEYVQCNVNGRSSINITGSSSGTAVGNCIVNGSINTGFTRDDFHLFNVNALQGLADGSTGTALEGLRSTFTAIAPPINNFDLSLSKKFFFWEKLNIEARLDAFNAFNQTQGAFSNFFEGSAFDTATRLVRPGSVGNALTRRTGFGAVNSYRPNRTVQWMLRFSF